MNLYRYTEILVFDGLRRRESEGEREGRREGERGKEREGDGGGGRKVESIWYKV